MKTGEFCCENSQCCDFREEEDEEEDLGNSVKEARKRDISSESMLVTSENPWPEMRSLVVLNPKHSSDGDQKEPKAKENNHIKVTESEKSIKAREFIKAYYMSLEDTANSGNISTFKTTVFSCMPIFIFLRHWK